MFRTEKIPQTPIDHILLLRQRPTHLFQKVFLHYARLYPVFAQYMFSRYFDTWCHEMASDPVDKDFILSGIAHGFHRVLPLASLQRKLTLIKKIADFLHGLKN